MNKFKELRDLLAPYMPTANHLKAEEIEQLYLELSAFFEAERK